MAQKGYNASLTLAADVANNGTFTVAYPSGTSQTFFTAGLGVPAGHYAIVNKNDQWTSGASKMSVTFGASNITITNTSGVTWTAGSTVDLFFDVQDYNDVVWLNFPFELASISSATDVVVDFIPGVEGVVEYVQFVVNVIATTASKAVTLTPKINGTLLTGGAVALTTANCGTLGAVVGNTADPSAGNVLARDSLLRITSSSVTAFAEGKGTLSLRIRRTRSSNIFA